MFTGKVKRAPAGRSKHNGVGWADNSVATSVKVDKAAAATGVAMRAGWATAVCTGAVCVGVGVGVGVGDGDGDGVGDGDGDGAKLGAMKPLASQAMDCKSRLTQATKVGRFKSCRRQNSAIDKPLPRQSRTRANQSARRC